MGDVIIENTVQFRFPAGSPRPSWLEIAGFIKQLETDVMLMESAYKTANERSVFIKFSSHDAMMDSLRKNAKPQHFVYTSVFDLPPELPDDKLLSVLGEYGKVDRVVREKFPTDLGLDHLCTGVRGVYVNVEKDIPPSIDVVGRNAKVFYDGLKHTCFVCRKTGHRRDACPQWKPRKRKQNGKTQENSTTSYAAVVSGNQEISTEQPSEQQSTETLGDEVIEVLDEEYLDHSTDTEEAGQQQTSICETESASEKEIRRKENMKKLEEAAYAIKEAIENKTAKDRRAQFASSNSNSGSLPRKKVARRTFY